MVLEIPSLKNTMLQSRCILIHNFNIVTLLVSDILLAVYQYHNYAIVVTCSLVVVDM